MAKTRGINKAKCRQHLKKEQDRRLRARECEKERTERYSRRAQELDGMSTVYEPELALNVSAFLLFGIGDTITTLIAVSNGLYEHNPLMAPLIAESWSVFVVFKLCGLGLGLLVLYEIKTAFDRPEVDRVYLGCLLALSGWGAFITIGNTLAMLGKIG